MKRRYCNHSKFYIFLSKNQASGNTDKVFLTWYSSVRMWSHTQKSVKRYFNKTCHLNFDHVYLNLPIDINRETGNVVDFYTM